MIVLIAAGWYWRGRQRSDEPQSVLVPLTSYPGWEDSPSFSPDGTQVAFQWCTEGPSANCDIYIKQIGVEPPQRLTTDPAHHDKWPFWSQDGQSIYFDSSSSGTNQIWKVPAVGGKPVQITPNGESRSSVQESSDGRFFYYKKARPAQTSVWRMPVGGGEEIRVLDAIGQAGGYRVREQGIYFFAPPNNQDHSDICFYEFATGKTRKIRTIEGRIAYYIEASPDGRNVLYPQWDQAGSDLMLVENFR